MFDDVGGYVEGEMTVPQNQNTARIGEPDFNTLDEPIRDTIVRYRYCLRIDSIVKNWYFLDSRLKSSRN